MISVLIQIKIWEDRKAQPLVVLRPHDGQPVNAATFLTASHRPDHIILITAVCSFSFTLVESILLS